MSALELRPYRPGDEAELIALYALCYRQGTTEAAWRWRSLVQPSPTDTVFVAIDRGRIAAQYAGVFVRYRTPDGDRWIVHGQGALTHPEHRRQGIFGRLARHSHDVWRDAGATAVIGLPSPSWGSRDTYLGWRRLFPLAARVCPVRVIHRLPAPAAIDVTVADRIDDRFDALWSDVSGRYRFAAVRDAAFVRWRYLDAPDLDYVVLTAVDEGRLVGYAAYRSFEDCLVVSDLVAVDRAARWALVRSLASRAWAAGVPKLLAPVVVRSPHGRSMTSAGFVWTSDAVQVQIVPLGVDSTAMLASAASDWLVTGADFDVH